MGRWPRRGRFVDRWARRWLIVPKWLVDDPSVGLGGLTSPWVPSTAGGGTRTVGGPWGLNLFMAGLLAAIGVVVIGVVLALIAQALGT